MHFDPVTYIAGTLANDLPSLKNEGIAGRDVFILGSGPSIDQVDLSKIENSVVVTLNAAFQLTKYCGSGNKYYWFCQDTKALMEFLPRIPLGITKWITLHRFNKFLRIRRYLGRGDRFLQPRLSLRPKKTEKTSKSRFLWSPRPLMNSGPPFLYDPVSARLTLFPTTVMLTAISLFGGLGARRIVCMGFDLTPPNDDRKKVTHHVNQSYISPGFPNAIVNFYLEGLLDEMWRNGRELVNCSPLTHDVVLPKCSRFDVVNSDARG